MEELFYKSALYEGKTEGAALEKYIVDQWNSPNKKIVINNPKIDAEAPTKIVNFLKKKGLSGTARKLATEHQNGALSLPKESRHRPEPLKLIL